MMQSLSAPHPHASLEEQPQSTPAGKCRAAQTELERAAPRGAPGLHGRNALTTGDTPATDRSWLSPFNGNAGKRFSARADEQAVRSALIGMATDAALNVHAVSDSPAAFCTKLESYVREKRFGAGGSLAQ